MTSPIGNTMVFSPIKITHIIQEKAVQLEKWWSMEGILLQIHFGDLTTQSIEGSGVLIWPWIWLCAKHVIAPLFR